MAAEGSPVQGRMNGKARSGRFTRPRALAVVAAGVTAIAVLAAATATAAVRTGPAGLAFYHPPKTLPTATGP